MLLVTPPGFNVKIVPAVLGEVTVIVPSFTVAQLVLPPVAVPGMTGPDPTMILAGVTVPKHADGGTTKLAE